MNIYSEFIKNDDALLLVVDIQKVMLDLCVDAARTLKNAGALIEIAKIYNLPIIFSVHNAEKLGGVAPELLDQTSDHQILNKVEFSCFENQALCSAIEASGKKTLVIAGLETHICIFHTAALGLRMGYRVHVVADAVCSRKKLNWEIGLRRLEMAGAVISSTEMVIFELLNRAATPEFRQALPIIKTL